MNFEYLLKKYWDSKHVDKLVLKMIEEDVAKFCNDPFDSSVTYGGRGDSRKFSISEFLVPEFTDEVNLICYFHDRIYDLANNKVRNFYTKRYADKVFYKLLKAEGFKLAWLYYINVRIFG